MTMSGGVPCVSVTAASEVELKPIFLTTEHEVLAVAKCKDLDFISLSDFANCKRCDRYKNVY